MGKNSAPQSQLSTCPTWYATGHFRRALTPPSVPPRLENRRNTEPKRLGVASHSMDLDHGLFPIPRHSAPGFLVPTDFYHFIAPAPPGYQAMSRVIVCDEDGNAFLYTVEAVELDPRHVADMLDRGIIRRASSSRQADVAALVARIEELRASAAVPSWPDGEAPPQLGVVQGGKPARRFQLRRRPHRLPVHQEEDCAAPASPLRQTEARSESHA